MSLYACECTREEIDARTKANATPGLRRLLPRPGAGPRGAGPALPGPRRRDDGGPRPHPRRRDLRPRGHRGLRGGEVVGRAAVRAGQRGRRHRHGASPTSSGARTSCRRRPRACSCGPRSRAADAPLPAFAHLPLLVNERRQKLSKRRDDVAVESYRERGYLADAMRNYLALLGWSRPRGPRDPRRSRRWWRASSWRR